MRKGGSTKKMKRYDYSYSIETFYRLIQEIQIDGVEYKIYKCNQPDTLLDKQFFVKEKYGFGEMFLNQEKLDKFYTMGFSRAFSYYLLNS